ncbi:heterokaryon incompatibility protein-domain-containing protein [Plectosphaerella plurivora]|uniref:Heterokaryon incompatibility protein-domain-containing protein n=1 Tax=Plectosphaerella plurivora TaxID=936078 RepID=A0A9P8V6C5_9PEZI|nr:heterokaryon incompatibility protein-domain-containing protein [Plectosphaerella plurivora]
MPTGSFDTDFRDSIRLIRLQSGRPDDPVVCDLLEVLLGDTDGVPYSALSYTWGDSSMTRSIRLDGAHFEVTSNLYGALHNLRRQTEDRYLWVDAVCIDQNNTNKRNHQVGQMRRVYQYAESVIIWLGGSTCDIDQLLDSVNDLDRRLLEDEAPTKLVRVDRARYVWEWKINSSAKDKEDFSRRSRYAMEALLLRPWFNRIWVIQEAASAKTAAIACGQNSVPTRTFALMPELLGITPHERATALLEAMPGPLRRLSWWNEKPNLETLLRKFHGCDATDPRDKIYALLDPDARCYERSDEAD